MRNPIHEVAKPLDRDMYTSRISAAQYLDVKRACERFLEKRGIVTPTMSELIQRSATVANKKRMRAVRALRRQERLDEDEQ